VEELDSAACGGFLDATDLSDIISDDRDAFGGVAESSDVGHPYRECNRAMRL